MCIKHVVAGDNVSRSLELLFIFTFTFASTWRSPLSCCGDVTWSSRLFFCSDDGNKGVFDFDLSLRSAACRRRQRLYEWKRHVISLNGDLAPSAGHQRQHKTEKLQSVKQPCISNMLWSVMKSVTSSASKSSELHRSLHRQLRSDWFINMRNIICDPVTQTPFIHRIHPIETDWFYLETRHCVSKSSL